MNKSFINKLNGIRRNVISEIALLAVLVCCAAAFGPKQHVQAASPHSYTQIFQNPTTTLSGKAVQTSLYFSKMDYWQVKKATFSFNFQISQLASRQTSDLTLSLNGVKFLSFRPSKETGLQTKTVTLPLKLLSGSNTLQISGQILNQTPLAANVQQTPANWLTLAAGANVNFQFGMQEANRAINSWYAHFTGMDTIANHRSAIVVPNAPTADELTAAMRALSGVARIITTTDTKLPVVKANSTIAKQVDYPLVVAPYARLPKALAQAVAASGWQTHGVLATVIKGAKHYLVVTGKTPAMVNKAAKFVANEELMKETASATESVVSTTQTATSVLQYQGKRQLTTTETNLKGPGHQSASYFIALPTDRTNADGSKITLHYRYAKNLDFKRALVTVKLNDQILGSKRLTAAKADGDTLTVTVPKQFAVGNTFTISVDFDLEMYHQSGNDSDATPWATVGTDSAAYIRSKPRQELLFSNFPSTFIKDQTFDQVAVIAPKTLTTQDMATLTNVFNMLGNYVQQNTGSIKFYRTTPSKAVLASSSVIALGSPKQNAFIDQLNDQLYFKYAKNRSGFISNEKLSIEKQYGKTIGVAQLLRSPYNAHKALLVVTGATPQATLLASTQISTQAAISQYHGDAVVVDQDNNHYSYRFKKVAAVHAKRSVKKVITKNATLLIYLGLAVFMFALVLLSGFLILRKHAKHEGGDRHA
ncbi:cellulose biosynthesis cyclic di-GMP-binding regulatory protein BcsB [Lacticaseibacillus jixiensis]|uniref:cellulose biosynthesis cyclic di-GMP-binding regulatory protein BcsB n=1 Tax=Lacticaseibacillus jixiensis TaxID=3231926 RepID=UPI0036F1A3AC